MNQEFNYIELVWQTDCLHQIKAVRNYCYWQINIDSPVLLRNKLLMHTDILTVAVLSEAFHVHGTWNVFSVVRSAQA